MKKSPSSDYPKTTDTTYMSSTHLSLPLRLPDEERERYNRLATLTTQTANTLIEQYWTPDHLTEITEFRYFPNESRECCLSATKQSLSV
ncbi:Nitroimidazol reductase NimA or a related FMN-containing flavoprotein, pyridoxamine 5'-phosphate oxidase superfamily [Halapricum desulfuricans]|uniref:Nitroimidazol reductase NimA or a related FMN-containing flavoprotein, pyridoxamine 5'-phosphate oxidase superfamily n=1 Tax=Halapricum desulfuricans TaxID=2841257 RepID=A0A897NQ31_9EURY|nr:Nitroimidazol reductase NimA or a related FMN-containing flavoprotein, pyridoxamine 5'-phosphate oxidase superfamily [Halapricum desulfuricans]